MKKIATLLFLILLLSVSCKKRPDNPIISFSPFISAPDKITWDSVSYTTINFSYQSELTPEEINDPAIYSHSVNLDLKTEWLTLEPNQIIVIKKFDLVAKSGNIIYYIPFIPFSGELSSGIKLPMHINTGEGKNTYSFPVMRYKENGK
jgi:hypothetical protein